MGEMSFRFNGKRLPSALRLLSGLLAGALVCLPVLLTAAETEKEAVANRILAITYDQGTVHIRTDKPVEYRYRIYSAQDPLRVVADFPGMTLEELKSPEFTPDEHFVDLKTSIQESPAGSLARVELFLARPADYDVVLDEEDFRIVIAGNGAAAAETPSAGISRSGETTDTVAGETPAVLPVPEPTVPATKVLSVNSKGTQVALATDGKIGKFRYFPLGAPARLVVDLYGVTPDFTSRVFPLESGFNNVRVGTYPDKTRFVFDAGTQQLPAYAVTSTGGVVNVAWDSKGASAKAEPVTATPAKVVSGGPVTIKNVDFKVVKGRSILTIGLSGPAEVIEPVATGDVVRFGIKNANISRALRRAVDPSAFPSAIRLITPYTVLAGGTQDVRFAVELKGLVPYVLGKEGNSLQFVVENGPFAEPVPAAVETRQIPVAPGAPGQTTSLVAGRPEAIAERSVRPNLGTSPLVADVSGQEVYTGQKISLVFDDADIRNILQLIAEVSDLNIIAGDDVKGTMTLRLVDVPWDQALQLIMDIKGLGMLREGNVVRIMPKAAIRKMVEDEFTANRALEKMEDLVTEVITVSYSDLDSLTKRGKEYLTERGKIIGDVRNKQLIVTDVPSVVAGVRKLVALVDAPDRQVLIEARIVEAVSTFSRDLGVNWLLSYDNNPGGNSSVATDIGGGGSFSIPPEAVAAGFGGFASDFTFGRVGLDKVILDLRLSALEQSGQGRIISTPRVTTLNGQEAEIAQGTEIPYTTVSDEGTKIEFKKAELSLKVKPEINPDGSVFLEIEARNDSRGATVPTGVGEAVAIDTKKAQTKVLVNNGETTVIGGIFIEDKSDSDSGIPYLKNIPILGYLFKSKSVEEQRRELLIFITPRILD
jgi:type IV pilus assembly protein PilQ